MGPTEIYFEEAGFLLEDPLFAEKATDYLMTLAKKHAYLVMTAQSPEPFFRNDKLRSAVRDNIATVVFLPNKGAARGDLAHMLKTVFGLNENHLQIIQDALPKQEYCVWQPANNFFRVCVMKLPKEVVARLMSDASSRAVLKSTFNPSDPSWADRYLKRVLTLL
jgi:type IV secretion system protein VirB4